MNSHCFKKVVIWQDDGDGLEKKEKELENKLKREEW
jgi:hypothetical protein